MKHMTNIFKSILDHGGSPLYLTTNVYGGKKGSDPNFFLQTGSNRANLSHKG